MARLAAALVLSSILLAGSLARAESMIPPYCSCNDECKWKWPYSGVCVAKWGAKFCGYYNEGPGIPCAEAGVPKPDIGVPAKPDIGVPKPDVLPNIDVVTTKVCSCNQDCASIPSAHYCAKTPMGLRCSNWGPGLPCDGGFRGGEWDPPRPLPDYAPFHGEADHLWIRCQCNDDCEADPVEGKFCDMSYTVGGDGHCTRVGPGTPCGAASSVPSRGCSLGESDARGAGATAMVLLGVAALLIVWRRRRR